MSEKKERERKRVREAVKRYRARKQGKDTPFMKHEVYLPTPEEIAAECERIRAEWAEEGKT